MADTDAKLGHEIHKLFKTKGIETPLSIKGDWNSSGARDKIGQRIQIGSLMSQIMECLGLDLRDDSLQDTPKRVAKMYVDEIFGGLDYDQFPKCTIVENKMHYDELVLNRGSVIRSMCEHHFLPVYGKVYIGYLPRDRVLGLSKLSRVAEFFASRPQVQERLTIQVYEALAYILDTENVAVVIEAEHFCMRMRGVKDSCSDTVTSRMGGKFMSVPALRAEFMQLIESSGG